MIKLGVIVTIVAGLLGAYLGALVSFPNSGIIVAIAVMGGFIMAEMEDRNEE